MENKLNTPPQDAQRTGKLVHMAIPVRWSPVAQKGRGPAEMACTYDIHPRGARLLGGREVSVGDLLLVERGRNKAICQVLWTADRDSALRGQFTVRCVDEGKTPWDDELRQMEEQYQSVIIESPKRTAFGGSVSRAEANRRRRPRFYVEGQADVLDGMQRVAGEVQQISEFGARIAAPELLRPGADFRLMLNILDVSLALKAQVKYHIGQAGMGVEFHEIRRGDGPLLSYVLGKLKTRRVEEFAQVEVASEPLVAAAG
jgi:PilZ domain